MKLRIRLLKLTITYLVSMLVIGAIFFGIFFQYFITFPWDPICYIVIAIWLIGALIFYILSITKNYYVLSKKYVTVYKYNKQMVYNFSEIIYIDEAKSTKSKVIHFVTNKGHPRYLTFDRKNILYRVMLEKCTNRISKEELLQKFPKIDL